MLCFLGCCHLHRPINALSTVLGLGSQVLGLDACVLHSIAASDDDDVSAALRQLLYESAGLILRWSYVISIFVEHLHSLLGLTMYVVGPDLLA